MIRERAKRVQRIIDAHFINAEAVGVSGEAIYYIVNGNENCIYRYDVTEADLEMSVSHRQHDS